MSEGTAAIDSAAEHAVITKAWEQVNPEELVRAMRNVNPKVRGRMLSRLKTPSSKLTILTGRLLLTNLARAAHTDRLRAAETIARPVADTLGDLSDGVASLAELTEELTAEAKTSGPSIVVLATAWGVIADTPRYTRLLVACRDAGYLGPELARMADTLANAAARRAANAEEGVDDEDDVFGDEPLAELWERAAEATGRLADDIRAGRLPNDADVGLVSHYASSLSSEADRFGVEATVSAVGEAATRAELEAVLADRLRRLAGPEDVAAGLAAIHAAAEQVSADRVLAERLSRFLDVVSGSDNAARLRLARTLRGQPEPPSQEVLDAAMLGMLHFAATAVDTKPGERAVAPDEQGEELTSGQARQDSLLDERNASGAGTLFSQCLEVKGVDVETLAAVEEATDTEPEVEPRSMAASALAAGPGGAEIAGELVDASAPERQIAEASTEQPGEIAAAPTGGTHPAKAEENAAEASGEGMLSAKPPGSGPKQETPVEAVDRPADGLARETLSERECASTLARLVADRRFSLGHHLAQALGQDVRAAVLAEAALAEAVRRPTSQAAGQMVERALSVSVPAEDRGSVALRTASAVRVALLDPSSGAGEVLRQLLDSLAPMPALRAFAVAVIDASVRNFALSATGSGADAERAREQAAVIASWAEDTLERPRHNLSYAGSEIWKALTVPDAGPGQILAALAANDSSRADEVLGLCRKLSGAKDLDKAVLDAEAALHGGKRRAARTIVGGAKQSLLRALKEVVEQGWAWADAVRLTGSVGGGVQRIQTEAWELHPRLDGELDGGGEDDVTAAGLAAAAASLAETISLFGAGSLDGDELEPDAALNRDLVLVDGLSFDEDGVPSRQPRVSELVKAATETRVKALADRFAIQDFLTAEAIISLPKGRGEAFDATAAMRELRVRERRASDVARAGWAELDRRYAAARARGRISDADAAELGACLQQANPVPDGDAPRRDLGRVSEELEQLTGELDAAAERRREMVQADIEDAVGNGELDSAWVLRLTELFERDELGAAEEYLHRARAGEKSPEHASAVHEPEGLLGAVLAANPDGVTAEIVEAVRAGRKQGPLDFSPLDEAERTSVADALDAWVGLRFGERPANVDEPLSKVLRLLGIILRAVIRTPEMRKASSTQYWFADVDGETSGYAYVPDYGSRSGGRRRFMLCWAEALPVAQLWTVARKAATDDRPVYVLYFGTLGTKARLELARHSRAVHGQGVVVIDSTVMLRCASAGRQTYDVAMRAVLPYAAPNPYDPNLLTGMPAEMFYGRRVERDSVKSLNGTSIISGGRRLGKSALLRSAQQELARDNPDVTAELIVIQDVAAPPKNDPTELWPRLAGRLSEVGVLTTDAPGTADGVCSGIRAWLTDNPHKRLLLMLDETDFFLRADSNHGFANVVRLRDAMVDGGGRFKVVFSGLQHVARYRRLPNQPLSHFSEPLVIGPLDAASASELVRRPLHAIGWAISDAQVDRIVTYCACNPSVIQLACASLLARLNSEDVAELAPWTVPDSVINALLRSSELDQGVRDRLFLTLELDHRYKLLAYLLASRASTHGLGPAVPPAELRHMAAGWWPDGFSSQRTDDVRALCDELVGLGVFAGDAESGYRMLSPGMARLFGDAEEITEELLAASDTYEKDRAVGAAGSRMRLPTLGEHRYSPLTASQLADVIGAGTTQLRVVVGSRATRIDTVPQALVTAAGRLPKSHASVLEVNSLRNWRANMRAPSAGHLVVVSDMTVRGSETSWEQSIESAQRRGATRSGRGTRSAVLVAGTAHRWLLRRLVDRPDGGSGDLAGVTVGLQRVDDLALEAWDHIEELDLPSQSRQRRLLEVTGGWPFLVERVLSQRVAAGGFDRSLEAVAAGLASLEGAAELVAAVGLDPDDPDQPADRGLVAVFNRLVETGWRESLADLVALMALDDPLEGEDDLGEAVAILSLLGLLEGDENGAFGVEPVLSASWKLHHAPATA